MAWPVREIFPNVFPWGQFSMSSLRRGSLTRSSTMSNTLPLPIRRCSLLDRVRFFVEEPSEDFLREFIGDRTGTLRAQWRAKRLRLRRRRKRSRDDWNTEEGRKTHSQTRCESFVPVISALRRELRREEGVPFHGEKG